MIRFFRLNGIAIGTLEIIFCAFFPLQWELKRVSLKGVPKRVAEYYFTKVLIPFIGVRK